MNHRVTCLGHGDKVRTMLWIPDSNPNQLFSAGWDQHILGWAIPPISDLTQDSPHGDISPSVRLTGHRGSITQLSYDPTHQHLFSASKDGTIGVWDIATAQNLAFIPTKHPQVTAIFFDPTSHILYTAGSLGHICGWKRKAAEKGVSQKASPIWKEIAEYHGPSTAIHTLRVDPIRNLLFASGDEPNIFQWDLSQPTPHHIYTQPRKILFDLMVDTSDHLLYTVGQEKFIQIFEYTTAHLVESVPIPAPASAIFRKRTKAPTQLAWIDFKGQFHIFDLKMHAMQQTIDLGNLSLHFGSLDSNWQYLAVCDSEDPQFQIHLLVL